MTIWVNGYYSQVRVKGWESCLAQLLALYTCLLWHAYQGALVWLVGPHADDERAELLNDSREADETNPSTLGRKMYRNSISKDDEEPVRKIVADL